MAAIDPCSVTSGSGAAAVRWLARAPAAGSCIAAVARVVAGVRAACVAAAVVACTALAPAHAGQGLPAGVSLGMTVAQLQQAQPGLRRVARPVRMAGGLVGHWAGEAIDVAGVALVPTYFFAGGQLQRVEYLAQQGGPQPFSALLQWGRDAWGQELATAGPEGHYASWSVDGLDAYLQLPAGGEAQRARLVVRQQVLKDAGEL